MQTCYYDNRDPQNTLSYIEPQPPFLRFAFTSLISILTTSGILLFLVVILVMNIVKRYNTSEEEETQLL